MQEPDFDGWIEPEQDQTEPEPEPLAPEHERASDLLQYVAEIIAEKSRDNGTEDDPFRNLRTAEDWGVEPWVAVLMKVSQQVAALQNLAVTGEWPTDGKTAERTFLEIATGAIVGLVLYEEKVFQEQIAVVPMDTLPGLAAVVDAMREHLEHLHLGFRPREREHASDESVGMPGVGTEPETEPEIVPEPDVVPSDPLVPPAPDVVRDAGHQEQPDVAGPDSLTEAEAELRRESAALRRVAGRHQRPDDDTADLHEHGRHVVKAPDGDEHT